MHGATMKIKSVNCEIFHCSEYVEYMLDYNSCEDRLSERLVIL